MSDGEVGEVDIVGEDFDEDLMFRRVFEFDVGESERFVGGFDDYGFVCFGKGGYCCD